MSNSKNVIQTWLAGKTQNSPALSEPKCGQIPRTLGVAADLTRTFLAMDSNIKRLNFSLVYTPMGSHGVKEHQNTLA